MFRGVIRTLRFLTAWVTQTARVHESEVTYRRNGQELPATLVLPSKRRAALPGWIVLHGITRPGRAHPALLRFARSLASTGAAVLIPEIPEWRRLQLAPERAQPTIQAAVRALEERPETVPGRIGLVGFSFGAPLAVIAANHPALRGHVRGVVGFGGYCDLKRTLFFQLTGRHDWNGVEYEAEPDPYGRWVVAGNFLTTTPEFEEAHDVAEALLRLAGEAGDRGLYAGTAELDPLKSDLRETIAPERRALFDLFAPTGGKRPDVDEAKRVVRLIDPGVRRTAPLMDPAGRLDEVHLPVHLIHGTHDRLIPFTETLRLGDAMPDTAKVHVSLTGLFEHSRGRPFAQILRLPLELLRFFEALRKVLAML